MHNAYKHSVDETLRLNHINHRNQVAFRVPRGIQVECAYSHPRKRNASFHFNLQVQYLPASYTLQEWMRRLMVGLIL